MSTYNEIRINIGDHERWLSYMTSIDFLNIYKITPFSTPCLFLAFAFKDFHIASSVSISVNNNGVHAQLVITPRLSTDFCRKTFVYPFDVQRKMT